MGQILKAAYRTRNRDSGSETAKPSNETPNTNHGPRISPNISTLVNITPIIRTNGKPQ
jgi:hypothetical protein